MSDLSIGQLAKLTNVSIDTIRFYEKAGLLPPHLRRPSGFRQYSKLDLKQLRFIRRGRLLGFSLEDIGEFLALESAAGTTSSVVSEKVRAIDEKIDQLQQWRGGLLRFMSDSTSRTGRQSSMLDHFPDEPDNPQAVQSADRPAQPLRECDDQD